MSPEAEDIRSFVSDVRAVHSTGRPPARGWSTSQMDSGVDWRAAHVIPGQRQ